MNIFRTIKSKLGLIDTDNEFLNDDFFIVSYPKSGNTWMRFILGNYFFKAQLDFKSINEIMPDIHFNPEILSTLKVKPRIIKSHNLDKNFNNIIYVVRDGRDAAVSYYYHLKRTGEINVDMGFDQFLNEYFFNENIPYGTWGDHVKRYFDFRKNRKNILLIKYEDLILDTRNQMIQVLNWMNVKIDHKILDEAIHLSSFESLQNVERSNEEYIYNERKLKKMEYGFIRKGIIGDWKNHFSEEQNVLFFKNFGQQLTEIGYSD